ncbi:hypothetical protein PQO03_15740 [Lentisphaera profundi]|uniref:VOC domain-containing protein n=1 Tax=Lentisphaera profundi TaxID=1658616 RepID=A0ABY7VYF1_9BACT|nr:hypothetical protein [Lentisphaera profundi]WDE99288.1 hypothetical protein PQO03_15740 [Lentisphaera profundi]
MKKALQLDKCHILLRSKDVPESKSFFLALGLVPLRDTLFSDGSMCIELRDQVQSFPSLYIEGCDDQEIFDHYQDKGIVFDCSSNEQGETELFFTDPNGLNIFIGEKTPASPIVSSPCKILELSQSTKFFIESVNFFTELGFDCIAQRSNYPKTLMTNGPTRLALHDSSKYSGQGIALSLPENQIQSVKSIGFPLMKNADGSYLCFSPEGLRCTLFIS